MNKNERIQYLKENHFVTWQQTRRNVFEKLSNNQTMFCLCGRLATGLHENNCRKFNKKVDNETETMLQDLEKEIKHLDSVGFMSIESMGITNHEVLDK